MGTNKIEKTDTQVKFKDIKRGDMFFADNVYWTKHEWSIEGVTGATALAGYTNEAGYGSKPFDEDYPVFTVTQTYFPDAETF